MNVLSVDDERVVQDIQTPLIASLERAGFTAIPCPWRWERTLGGGFYCTTLDMRLRSEVESYLD
jgi:glycine amidinotransferase